MAAGGRRVNSCDEGLVSMALMWSSRLARVVAELTSTPDRTTLGFNKTEQSRSG